MLLIFDGGSLFFNTLRALTLLTTQNKRNKERKNERKMLGRATAGKMAPVDKLPAVRKEPTHRHSNMLVNCENTPT